MKKLTKVINHRHKNYKPTIGLTNNFGKKFSVNSIEYYTAKKQEEKRQAEKEARKFMIDFMFEKCPKLVQLLNIANAWSYYF